MSGSRRRDRLYWLKRLRAEYPGLAEQVDRGALTVRAACIKARLIKSPSRLDALKREWKKANLSDKRAFIMWLKASVSGKPRIEPLTASGYLTTAAIKQIHKIMADECLKPGQVMAQMGFKRLDPRLGFALRGDRKVNPEFAEKLEAWLSRRL